MWRILVEMQLQRDQKKKRGQTRSVSNLLTNFPLLPSPCLQIPPPNPCLPKSSLRSSWERPCFLERRGRSHGITQIFETREYCPETTGLLASPTPYMPLCLLPSPASALMHLLVFLVWISLSSSSSCSPHCDLGLLVTIPNQGEEPSSSALLLCSLRTTSVKASLSSNLQSWTNLSVRKKGTQLSIAGKSDTVRRETTVKKAKFSALCTEEQSGPA